MGRCSRTQLEVGENNVLYVMFRGLVMPHIAVYHPKVICNLHNERKYNSNIIIIIIVLLLKTTTVFKIINAGMGCIKMSHGTAVSNMCCSIEINFTFFVFDVPSPLNL